MAISKSIVLYIYVLLLQGAYSVQAQTIFTATAGTAAIPAQWNSTSSWSCGGCGKYPGQSAINDIVIIDSDHGIFLGAAGINITVGTISINNGTLIVRSSSTLNANSVSMVSSSTSIADFSIYATVTGSPTVNISGDVTIDRNAVSDAGSAAYTRLRIGGSNSFLTNSVVTVNGNLVYNYNSASNTTVESSSEISVGGSTSFTDNCKLEILGDVSLNYNFNSAINNNVLSFEVGGSSSVFMRNLNLKITESGSGVGSDIRVATKDKSNSSINVRGNVEMTWDDSVSPNSDSDIYLKAGNDASDAATSITVDGDLTMVSNSSTGSTNNWVRVSGTSIFTLKGALNFSASTAITAAQENQIELYDASHFEIKGAISNTSQGCFDFEPTGSVDNATILFSGTVPQNFPTNFPTTAGSYYKNLVINNSSGTPMAIPLITRGISAPTNSSDINIKSSIQLLSGIILGSSTKAIILEDGATTTSGNSMSFVDGIMKKRGGVSNNALTLPLGAGAKWAPVSVSNITGADATTLMGFQYFNSGYPVTAVDPTLAVVNSSEYWNTTVSGTAPQVSMTFFWEDACQSNITDVASSPSQSLVVGAFNGTTWSKVLSTINPGSAACDNSTLAAETGSISIVTTAFVPYSFATVSTALAIMLLDFQGQAIDNKVILTWTTTAERNVDHFEIEHSIDGINFISIGKQNPLGYLKNVYTLTDLFPHQGISYYRLVEKELDGNKINHKTIAVDFKGATRQFLTYPNPVNRGDDLFFLIKDDTEAKLELYEPLSGSSSEMRLANGINKIRTDDFQDGVYVYKLSTKDGLFVGKVMIK